MEVIDMKKKGDGKWVKFGVVGVDSGQLMICDPCYIDSEWKEEDFDMDDEEVVHPNGKVEPVVRCSRRWFELIDDINDGKIQLRTRANKKPKHNFSFNSCAKTTLGNMFGQLNFEAGHPGVAVAFRSGLGDGLYEVFGKIKKYDMWGERISEVRIVLIEDDKRKEVEEHFIKNYGWKRK
jgi:hypothetical protein